MDRFAARRFTITCCTLHPHGAYVRAGWYETDAEFAAGCWLLSGAHMGRTYVQGGTKPTPSSLLAGCSLFTERLVAGIFFTNAVFNAEGHELKAYVQVVH